MNRLSGLLRWRPGWLPGIAPGMRPGNAQGRVGSARMVPVSGPPGDASATTDMSAGRRFAWRTWGAYGGHPLTQRFDTPAEAGEWRRENFGTDHHGLTLVAVDALDRPRFVTADELCEAQWAWQRPDLDNETAAGPVAPEPAA